MGCISSALLCLGVWVSLGVSAVPSSQVPKQMALELSDGSARLAPPHGVELEGRRDQAAVAEAESKKQNATINALFPVQQPRLNAFGQVQHVPRRPHDHPVPHAQSRVLLCLLLRATPRPQI